MTAIPFMSDFYGDGFVRDPIPQYSALRAAGPVLWREQNSCYAVAHYDEVVAVLRNDSVFSSGRGLSVNDHVIAMPVGSTLSTDGDAYDLQSSVTEVPIMPKNIKPLEDYIHTTAEALTERLVVQGSFDAIRDFATVLPLSVVVVLIGFQAFPAANSTRADFKEDRMARHELINLIGAMVPHLERWHLEGAGEIAMNNTIGAFSTLPVRWNAA